MKQPVPTVSDDDVERIAIRGFGSVRLSRVLDILQEYGKQDWNRPGSARVRLAILKLANGDLSALIETTKRAIEDFRDVIALAEYPRYSAEVRFDASRPDFRREVIEDDWRQYCEWLDGRLVLFSP